MTTAVVQTVALGAPPWPTIDPFLFCVHHVDAYPRGNDRLGPAASLTGRDIGQDFAGIDGWRMYHGDVVPGFPAHPHRGFETVTIARRGFIDHSDSLGATARFGRGDTQWMTAGAGIVHAEMFPLLNPDEPNPVELFQIWLNLPQADKAVDPYFTMLWAETIPQLRVHDDAGHAVGTVTVVAGELDGLVPPPPPPNSWAARTESDLAIWLLQLDHGGAWPLPPARSDETVRTLYVFAGTGGRIDGQPVSAPTGVVVRGDRPITIEAGEGSLECLLLQGRPIGEPVAQYGPFVMNDRAGIEQAFADYRRTGFGGWSWPSEDPVHPRDRGRFARHADGRVEER